MTARLVSLCTVAAVAVVVVGAACATDPARDDQAPPAEVNERSDDGVPTTPIESPTPIETTPTTPTTPPPTPLHGAIGQAPPPRVDPIQVTIFNRYLVKPSDQSLPEGEIRRIVEDVTGARVTQLRRTVVRYWLVQLEPATPPRQAAQQRAVLEQLKASGAFAVVEPDQIMTIK
jgi:hypothetical protein